MLVQVLLVLAILLVLTYFLSHLNTMQLRAGKKIAFVLFAALAVASVLYPNALTVVANMVGVGRGTDLVLYGLVVGFVFVSLNVYVKFKELQQRHAKVVRALALLEARVEELEQPAESSSKR
jgi:small membrane protein